MGIHSAEVTRSRWWVAPTAFGVGIAIALGFLWDARHANLLLDDAYIAFRYAENWALGHGPTWNVGEDPVEGFTSFAWVAIAAAVQRLTGLRPHESMPVVGKLVWMAFVAGVFAPAAGMAARLSPTLAPSRRFLSLFAACVVLLLLGLAHVFFVHSVMGLETSLYIAMFLLCAFIAFAPPTPVRIGALAIATWFTIAVRPDGIAFVVPLWALYLLYAPRESRRAVMVGGGAFCALTLAYVTAKWMYYGYPVPNTFFMKVGTRPLAGAGYVVRYGLFTLPIWLFGLVALILLGPKRLLGDRIVAVCIGSSLAFLAALVAVEPILGLLQRFAIPTLPVIVVGAIRAYALVLSEEARPRVRSVVGTVAVAGMLVWLGVNVRALSEESKRHTGFNTEYTNAITGRLLSEAPSMTRIAVVDAGATPYYSRLPTVDMFGLNNEFVAHHGFTHEFIADQQIDLYILQDLYLRPMDTHISSEDVSVAIEGKLRALDLDRYKALLHWGEMHLQHSGAGTTYQVLTSQNFNEDYVHINDVDYNRGRDRYYTFLRKDYRHFDTISKMVWRRPGITDTFMHMDGKLPRGWALLAGDVEVKHEVDDSNRMLRLAPPAETAEPTELERRFEISFFTREPKLGPDNFILLGVGVDGPLDTTLYVENDGERVEAPRRVGSGGFDAGNRGIRHLVWLPSHTHVEALVLRLRMPANATTPVTIRGVSLHIGNED